MQKEYIGSLGVRHNLTKYTLTNGVEVILNKQEEEELFKDTELFEDTLGDYLLLQNDHQYLVEEANELEELLAKSERANEKYQNHIEVLETRLEKYKDIVKTFKDFQEQVSKVKV